MHLSFHHLVEPKNAAMKKLRFWFSPIFIGVIFFILFVRCGKNDAIPTVQIFEIKTTSLADITISSASSGGIITSNGNVTITARGLCWSTNQNPTIEHNKTIDGTGIGNFISRLTNLSANTIYFLRAYATNNRDSTIYGNEIILKTYTGTVTDVDGNIYNTVTIGAQVWMAENLKTTRYRNNP